MMEMEHQLLLTDLLNRLAGLRAAEILMLAEFGGAPPGLERAWDAEQEKIVRIIAVINPTIGRFPMPRNDIDDRAP